MPLLKENVLQISTSRGFSYDGHCVAEFIQKLLTIFSAVYFELKQYDECIATCEKAVEVGRENRADYTNIAKYVPHYIFLCIVVVNSSHKHEHKS